MSCDRESAASCQDLLAMSRTVLYCTGYTTKDWPCVSLLLARGESNQGKRAAATTFSRGRMHSRQSEWRDEIVENT